jgi:hypothetical protein
MGGKVRPAIDILLVVDRIASTVKQFERKNIEYTNHV